MTKRYQTLAHLYNEPQHRHQAQDLKRANHWVKTHDPRLIPTRGSQLIPNCNCLFTEEQPKKSLTALIVAVLTPF